MTYKAKPLASELTDFKIKDGCFAIQFISFEAAIRDFCEKYNRDDRKPVGYRITEQGIEICY